jgi:hypothetical protein
MRVQCALIGCCYKLTSSGRNNRREQSLLVQQPSRVAKLLWSSVVLLLSGRCSSQQKDERTHTARVLPSRTARVLRHSRARPCLIVGMLFGVCMMPWAMLVSVSWLRT